MRTHSESLGAQADATTHVLDGLLRGELSAVETYELALGKLAGSPVAADLEDCCRSHRERAEMLRQKIVQLGGEPSEGSGAWGTFAKLVEGGAAALFGERAAIAALEEGEDHGLEQYRREIPKLDAATREIVERSLLPEQERTHRVLSAMKHPLH